MKLRWLAQVAEGTGDAPQRTEATPATANDDRSGELTRVLRLPFLFASSAGYRRSTGYEPTTRSGTISIEVRASRRSDSAM